jgi:flagellar hook-length control protein FliK
LPAVTTVQQQADTGAEFKAEEKAVGMDSSDNPDDTVSEKKDLPAANSEGQNQSAGEQQTGLMQDTEAPKPAEISGDAVVVVQKGDETVIEVGGKTIARTGTQMRQGLEIISQIAEKMKIDFKQEITEMKLNLRPNDLGSLSIKVIQAGGLITAEIVTENSKVKELVDQNLESLRHTLKALGIDVGELSVSVGQQEIGEGMRHFMQQKGKSQARINQILGTADTGSEESAVKESDFSGSTMDVTA